MKWKAGMVSDEAHTWFAWHPVCVRESNVWVWLEPVIRRLERGSENGDSWYYRLPTPEPKETGT